MIHTYEDTNNYIIKRQLEQCKITHHIIFSMSTLLLQLLEFNREIRHKGINGDKTVQWVNLIKDRIKVKATIVH